MMSSKGLIYPSLCRSLLRIQLLTILDLGVAGFLLVSDMERDIERDSEHHAEHAAEASHNPDASVSEGASVAPEPVEKKKFIKFNYNGEPIGEGSGSASSKRGFLVRTQVPVTAKDWKKADEGKKEQVWTKMKELFNFTDAQKDTQMRKAGQQWKKYKNKLRQYIKGDNFDNWIAAKPEKISGEDWYEFCVMKNTPEQKQLRERNKKNKTNTPMKSTHNTGRYGYARAEQMFIEQFGRRPLLVELWLYTHKRKDGTYAAHDRDYAEKFQQMVNIMHEKGQKDSIDSGPLATAFGLNKRGRTRCVSSVISRSAILSSSFATHLLQEIDGERQNLNAAIESLHKDNADLKEQVKELVEGLKNGTFDAHRRSQTPSYVPSASGGSRRDSTGPSNTLPAEIRCAILSHYGDIVGYGIKNPLGVGTVHGYTLKPDEARVCIEKIVDPTYRLWGKQFGLTTLGEVDVGGFIYWLDSLLVPIED